MEETLATMIKPAVSNPDVEAMIRCNAKTWAIMTVDVLRDHYKKTLQVELDKITSFIDEVWRPAFQLASTWAKKHLGRRLMGDTLGKAEALIVAAFADPPVNAEVVRPAQSLPVQTATRVSVGTHTDPTGPDGAPGVVRASSPPARVVARVSVATSTDAVAPDWSPEVDREAIPPARVAPIFLPRRPEPPKEQRVTQPRATDSGPAQDTLGEAPPTQLIPACRRRLPLGSPARQDTQETPTQTEDDDDSPRGPTASSPLLIDLRDEEQERGLSSVMSPRYSSATPDWSPLQPETAEETAPQGEFSPRGPTLSGAPMVDYEDSPLQRTPPQETPPQEMLPQESPDWAHLCKNLSSQTLVEHLWRAHGQTCYGGRDS
ncbi:uncharacterized protein [Nerophis lumbriciformis]|uniref:uncharacterized protein n=1 Tax=Nerophis lumbriciformis TaxID=546530 RepID=UPI003BA98AA4